MVRREQQTLIGGPSATNHPTVGENASLKLITTDPDLSTRCPALLIIENVGEKKRRALASALAALFIWRRRERRKNAWWLLINRKTLLRLLLAVINAYVGARAAVRY